MPKKGKNAQKGVDFQHTPKRGLTQKRGLKEKPYPNSETPQPCANLRNSF